MAQGTGTSRGLYGSNFGYQVPSKMIVQLSRVLLLAFLMAVPAACDLEYVNTIPPPPSDEQPSNCTLVTDLFKQYNVTVVHSSLPPGLLLCNYEFQLEDDSGELPSAEIDSPEVEPTPAPTPAHTPKPNDQSENLIHRLRRDIIRKRRSDFAETMSDEYHDFSQMPYIPTTTISRKVPVLPRSGQEAEASKTEYPVMEQDPDDFPSEDNDADEHDDDYDPEIEKIFQKYLSHISPGNFARIIDNLSKISTLKEISKDRKFSRKM